MLASDAHCPQCGSEVRNLRGQVIGRTASAVLMGLALAGCPAEDDPQDTMGGSGSGSSSEGSSSAGSTSMTTDSTSSEVTSGTSMGESSDATTFESSAAYGVPGTSTGPDTDTDTDTDGTSTGISPDYGVPTTGE